MRRFQISGLLTYKAIDTLKEKGAAGIAPPLWYTDGVNNVLTISEFARLGGKARAAKLTPERRREIAKKASDAAKAALDKRRKTTPSQ